MELRHVATVLWRWRWLLALAMLVALACSLVADRQLPRIYRTTTTIQVGQFLQSTNPQPQDFSTSQQLAQAYALMVRQPAILEAVIRDLGLETPPGGLAGQVSALALPGSPLIQVSVADTDPQRAKTVADRIARQLIDQSPTPSPTAEEVDRQFVDGQLASLRSKILDAEDQILQLEQQLAQESSARAIQDIQTQQVLLQQKISTWQSNFASLLDFYKGSRVNYLSVVEPAGVPSAPVSPDTRLNLMLAAVMGLLLATGAAFLIEYLDDSIKTSDDAERVLAAPTLSTISRLGRVSDPADHLAALRAPRSFIAEAYRVLHTNIQFSSLAAPVHRMLVTSAGSGEGKTTVASNLAITMARSGKRVILADGDLRRPSIHRFFGVSNKAGLTSLLLDEALPLDAVLVETPVTGLKLLPSGPLPPNPAELLSSPQMIKRVGEIPTLADVVIFDSRSVLGVADAAILGRLCDGVILVVDSSRTRTGLARRGKAALDQVGLRVLGVVLNKQAGRPVGDYGSYADAAVGVGGRIRRVSAALSSLFSGLS